jgi:predicted nicotinamide N-methyase
VRQEGSCDALPAPEELLHRYTRVQSVAFVPEIRLWLADELVPLWQATEWRAAAPQPPPFWAFAWPGSLALARYLLDAPEVIAGKGVLDFGAGGGLAAIAAVKCGASVVTACDIDALALVAQRMNAELNGVAFASTRYDALEHDVEADVVLAGDVCYERETAAEVTGWLRRQVDRGVEVLLADPGRHYVPSDGLDLLATYDVPVLHELESMTTKRTRLWRMQRASQAEA